MRTKSKLIQIILVWILAILFWQLIQFKNNTESAGESQLDIIISTLIVGVLFGVNFFFINRGIDKGKNSISKLSYGGLILVYALLHFISFSLAMLLVIVLLSVLGGGTELNRIEEEISNFIWSIDMLKVYLYTYVISTGIFLIQIVNQKFGPGVLRGLLLGRYRKPVERNLIFLFMDLKSSTSYAERLGHVKYSQLIQDCFADLTKAMAITHASVYQYVGDEVVLIWPFQKGIKNANCVRMYYLFKETIKERANYYLNNYGLVPEFKAGLNGGTLMAAEVGVVKRSIAYHGDVINTASRLQHLCGDLNKEFLSSEEIKIHLPNLSSVKYQFVEYRKLKGKDKMVGIYEINK